MEPVTHQAKQVMRTLSPLEAQLRECFGRVAYTHKTHEKCADRLLTKLAIVKWAQIALSALTTGGLITVLLGKPDLSHVSAIISAFASAALLALNTYTKESDPGQKAEKHKEVASKLWDVRESYLSAITDLRSGRSEEEVRPQRDKLQSDLVKIYETAPRTDAKAYGKAQEGLQKNEELTFSDDELDLLLPPALRR
jgi:hypothetical protein